MKCTYCGAELKDHHRFCISCGTKITRSAEEMNAAPACQEPVEVEPKVQMPVVQEPVAEAPVVQMAPVMPKFQEPVPGFLEKAEERRVTIDPEKFGYDPVKREDPLSRSVSSWELIPSDAMTPKLALPTKRGLGKMIFLGLITLGIYPMVIFSKIITELNILASRYDGKRTMTFYGMAMLAPLTLGIYAYVWFHKLCGRIGNELQRRGIDYKFGPSQFWLWNVLGAFILVGPFVFLHKLMKSMNLLNQNYNEKG